jgi:hypothetical protein
MRHLAFFCILVAFLSVFAAAAGAKPDEVVAKSLDSIGTADARAAVKSRAVRGSLTFKILVGGSGEFTGKWQAVSEQHKTNLLMTFNDVKWRGERFVSDGDKTSIASATEGYHRSSFAEFVNSYSFIVKDGLLGGEFSTNWCLQDVDHHHFKLENIGLKKIDGRELQGLEYLSKTNGEMTVRFYFEPDTGRHVMTAYSVVQGAGIAHNDVATARQKEVRYTIEERFSDFQADGGITLPRSYDLRFTQELQNGSTSSYDWSMTAEKVVNNANVDPKNFELK